MKNLKIQSPSLFLRFSAIVWLMLAACSPQVSKINEGTADTKISRSDSDSNSNDDEHVDVPVKITGSYLVCAIRKQARADDLSAQYGCRLNEEGTTKKVDLVAANISISWGSNASPNVKIVELERTNIWHAYYNLTGRTIDEINRVASALEIRVSLTESAQMIKQSKASQVTQSAVDYGDTSAPVVQQGGINPLDPPAI